MSWQTIERAIQQAAATATGLTCVWENQTRTRPSRPFCSMQILNITPVAMDDDELDNPSPSAGQEILIRTIEHAEFVVEFNIYTADITGTNSARYRAQALGRYFEKATVTDALDLTSPEAIAVVRRSAITDAPVVLETEYEGRANMNVTFRAAFVDDTAVTYIETAEFSGTYEE